VESISDVKKREIKSMEKRYKELMNFRYQKDENGRRYYDGTDNYYSLPNIARKAIDKEIRDLELKIKMLTTNSEMIQRDLRKAIENVFKYYGVEDKLPEIEENFNRYKEDRLQNMIEDLGKKIADEVKWEERRRGFY
jgi:hypothetical protein